MRTNGDGRVSGRQLKGGARLVAATALLLAAALLIAACGGGSGSESTEGGGSTTASSESGGSSGSGAESSSGAAYVETAKEIAHEAETGLVYAPSNEYTSPEELKSMTSWLGPTESPPLPKGKTIAFVSCGAEICNETGEVGVEIAEKAGFKAELVNKNGAGDVQNLNQAMSSALALHPAAIVGICVTATQVAEKLEQAEGEGVITISTCDPTPTGGKGEDTAAADFANGLSTELLGWAIVANTEGEANVVAIEDRGYPAVIRKIGNLVKVIEGCSGCAVKTATWQAAEAANPATAANFLTGLINANPEMTTLVMPYSIGIQSAVQAVASSGREIDIYADDADLVNLQELRGGHTKMLSSVDPQLVMYQAVDQAIRGLDESPFVEPAELPYLGHLYTQQDAPKTGVGAFVKYFDYPAEYEKMWGEK